jgi:hypothetical protein
MSARDLNAMEVTDGSPTTAGEALLRPLVDLPSTRQVSGMATGVVVGELIALKDDGRTALVRHPRLSGAAFAARSVVDLHRAHIGRPVVLLFEEGDTARPIVMGVLRDDGGMAIGAPPGQVEVEADGERMIVSAREQLVLRCGDASITLTRSGKVLIRGAFILSHAAGVHRIKGGTVEIN